MRCRLADRVAVVATLTCAGTTKPSSAHRTAHDGPDGHPRVTGAGRRSCDRADWGCPIDARRSTVVTVPGPLGGGPGTFSPPRRDPGRGRPDHPHDPTQRPPARTAEYPHRRSTGPHHRPPVAGIVRPPGPPAAQPHPRGDRHRPVARRRIRLDGFAPPGPLARPERSRRHGHGSRPGDRVGHRFHRPACRADPSSTTSPSSNSSSAAGRPDRRRPCWSTGASWPRDSPTSASPATGNASPTPTRTRWRWPPRLGSTAATSTGRARLRSSSSPAIRSAKRPTRRSSPCTGRAAPGRRSSASSGACRLSSKARSARLPCRRRSRPIGPRWPTRSSGRAGVWPRPPSAVTRSWRSLRRLKGRARSTHRRGPASRRD